MGKLEETFNLPDTIQEISDKADDITEYFENDESELLNDIDQYNKDLALLQFEEVVDFSQYDKEMDELSSKTITEFEDLMALGKDVEIRHAGEIFQAAAQMAKIALDARNNKMTAKLKFLELKLRKQRNDQIQQKQDAELNDEPDDGPVRGSSLSKDEIYDVIAELRKTQDTKKG